RLLDQRESCYDRALLLTLPGASADAEDLAREMQERVPDVEVRTVDVDDPSNYAALLEQITRLAGELGRSLARERWRIDVLLSAGSPEAQAVWALLVQARVLPARLLQLVPSECVIPPDAPTVREVRFDIGRGRQGRSAQTEVLGGATAPPAAPPDLV